MGVLPPFFGGTPPKKGVSQGFLATHTGMALFLTPRKGQKLKKTLRKRDHFPWDRKNGQKYPTPWRGFWPFFAPRKNSTPEKRGFLATHTGIPVWVARKPLFGGFWPPKIDFFRFRGQKIEFFRPGIKKIAFFRFRDQKIAFFRPGIKKIIIFLGPKPFFGGIF